MQAAASTQTAMVCRGTWYVLWCAAAATLAIFIAGDFRNVLVAVPDDAAYFLKIAANVAAGGGTTFDGLNPTNGIQPLWLLVLAGASLVHAGSPESMLREALAIQAVLMLASALVLYRALERVLCPTSALVGGACFLAWVVPTAINGMESALLITTFVAVFVCGRYVEQAPAGSSPRRWALLGPLVGATVLARLDSIFLLGALAAADWRAASVGARTIAARLAWVLVLAVAVVAPYALYNKLVFGAIMPISGALKSHFPRPDWLGAWGRMQSMGRFHHVCLAAAAGWLGWAFWVAYTTRGRARHPGYHEVATSVLAATLLAHAVHTALFMSWGVFGWHFITYPLILVLLGAEMFAHLDRRRLALTGALITAAAITFLGARQYRKLLTASVRFPDSWILVTYDAALWARDHTAPDAVFAMKDAGNFGLYSLRRTVNLDGVVNNAAYQQVLRDQRLAAYLDRLGVDYLVQHGYGEGDPNLQIEASGGRGDVNTRDYVEATLRYASHMYGGFSDPVGVRRDGEAYRSREYGRSDKRTSLVIWRLSTAEIAAASPVAAVGD